VDRDRDGRSFSARHVNAVQQGEVIFSALASFHLETDGPDMQIEDAPVDMGVPDSLPVRGRGRHELLLDVRDGSTDDPGYVGSRFWVRSRSALADDPVTRACVLTFVSDLGYGLDSVAPAAEYFGPSLDHAVWLHRTVDVNDWMFVELRPRTLAGSRGVFTGTVHDAAGTLAAYLAQEALLRGPR
jgi:acyl-CoA thioesterase-2